MPRKLKLELDFETVRALRAALNARKEQGAVDSRNRRVAPNAAKARPVSEEAGRGFADDVLRLRGSYTFLNALRRTVGAMVESYNRAIVVKSDLTGPIQAPKYGPAAPDSGMGVLPRPPYGEEVPRSGAVLEPGTSEAQVYGYEAGQAAEGIPAPSFMANRLSAGDEFGAGGTTVINHFTNYYAVPVQRSSEAPSEWADGMACT